MSRRALKVPSYCLHRASGRAVVRLGGRDVYLGEYGSPESHEEYERVIAEWRSGRNGRTVPPSHARRPADPEYAVLCFFGSSSSSSPVSRQVLQQ